MERGATEVIDAVNHGDIPVSLAPRFVSKVANKNEQRRIAKLGVDEIRKVVKGPQRELQLSQHIEKLVDVITKIREKWPPEHLTTLTEKLVSLSTEIKEGIQSPDPLLKNRGEAGIRSLAIGIFDAATARRRRAVR